MKTLAVVTAVAGLLAIATGTAHADVTTSTYAWTTSLDHTTTDPSATETALSSNVQAPNNKSVTTTTGNTVDLTNPYANTVAGFATAASQAYQVYTPTKQAIFGDTFYETMASTAYGSGLVTLHYAKPQAYFGALINSNNLSPYLTFKNAAGTTVLNFNPGVGIGTKIGTVDGQDNYAYYLNVAFSTAAFTTVTFEAAYRGNYESSMTNVLTEALVPTDVTRPTGATNLSDTTANTVADVVEPGSMSLVACLGFGAVGLIGRLRRADLRTA